MVPMEIEMSSLRRESYDQDKNHLLQRYELDIIEDKRNTSQLQVASYHCRTVRCYNSKVKQKRFQMGDLVLRRVVQSNGALDQN